MDRPWRTALGPEGPSRRGRARLRVRMAMRMAQGPSRRAASGALIVKVARALSRVDTAQVPAVGRWRFASRCSRGTWRLTPRSSTRTRRPGRRSTDTSAPGRTTSPWRSRMPSWPCGTPPHSWRGFIPSGTRSQGRGVRTRPTSAGSTAATPIPAGRGTRCTRPRGSGKP